MLLNITTTHQPATDLGFLLHKHPDRFQSVDLSVGQAHVFYPEASHERTTASLLLDIDPIDMVRSGKNFAGEGFALGHYVNDRPYVASSFMSVAISKAFASAMNGVCNNRPELLGVVMPLEVQLSALPAPHGGERLIRALFEPLGYEVGVERHALDAQFSEWGDSRYYSLTLKHVLTIQALLSHLYVLIPTLDNDKHYFVSESEIDKLLEKGEGWLKTHPEKEQITSRYLRNFKGLTRMAMSRLNDDTVEIAEMEAELPTEQKEKKESLHQLRLKLVTQKLVESGARRVLDLGCGEGKLLRLLLKEKQFTDIVGMDVSYQDLVRARERLHYEHLAPKQKERLNLFQGSLTYRDARLKGFDAAAVVEVIEHMELNRLTAFERALFGYAQPKTVVLTTPNQEYNALYEDLHEHHMRHDDHRFEWTRAEFEAWAMRVAETFGYVVEFFAVGEVDDVVGASSQMAVFVKADARGELPLSSVESSEVGDD
jgi:3' terminal RNA ribose 2'-O-methyltransferase Hen1